MPKRESKSGTNRTFRLSDLRLEMLRQLSEKFESTDNSTVSRAILEMWEREFKRQK